jgi:superfamily I DNA and RNA helicase
MHGESFDNLIVEEGIKEGKIALVDAHNESTVLARIEKEIRKLRSEGFALGDIAVLSLRGQSAEGGIAKLDKIGSFSIVRADDRAMTENIVGDTFLRFKGLERPAVIVTDLRLVKDRKDVRMHIALTRATDVVRIVGIGIET